MMIARIIISLKKVASSREPYIDLQVPSGLSTHLRDGHSHRTTDDIPLSVLESERVGQQLVPSSCSYPHEVVFPQTRLPFSRFVD